MAVFEDPGSQTTPGPASEGDNGALPSSYHHQAQILLPDFVALLSASRTVEKN